MKNLSNYSTPHTRTNQLIIMIINFNLHKTNRKKENPSKSIRNHNLIIRHNLDYFFFQQIFFCNGSNDIHIFIFVETENKIKENFSAFRCIKSIDDKKISHYSCWWWYYLSICRVCVLLVKTSECFYSLWRKWL